MATSQNKLAEQTLALLVMDLGYNEEPTNAPLRHQVAWNYCVDILGKDYLSVLVGEMHRQVADENIIKQSQDS